MSGYPQILIDPSGLTTNLALYKMVRYSMLWTKQSWVNVDSFSIYSGRDRAVQVPC